MDSPPVNPYAAPAAPLETPKGSAAAAGGQYRPLFLLANLVTAALAVNILVEVWVAFNAQETISIMEKVVAGDDVHPDLIEGIDDRAGLIAMGQFAVGLASAICFSLLVARASRNAHSYGQMPMQVTPGWAVAYFFIPILSWWKPYQAMKEIWRASSPDTSDAAALAQLGVPPLLPAWWAAFIAHVLLGQASTRMSRHLDHAKQVMTAAYVDIFSSVATIVAAVLAIALVRALARRQDACQTAAEAWRASHRPGAASV